MLNTSLYSFKENKSGDNDSDEPFNESINKSSDESQSKYQLLICLDNEDFQDFLSKLSIDTETVIIDKNLIDEYKLEYLDFSEICQISKKNKSYLV